MKIAIFQDYWGVIGGDAKVVSEMAKIFDADIITTGNYVVKKINTSVRVINLGKIIKYPRFKRISATLKFYFCDFSTKYNLFIFGGNWAHYAAHVHHLNLWYYHTPGRGFYDNYIHFLRTLSFFKQIFFRGYAQIIRVLDWRSILHIDRIVVNSYNVQMRVKQEISIGMPDTRQKYRRPAEFDADQWDHDIGFFQLMAIRIYT